MFDRVLETESLLASNHHCAMFLAGNLAVPASFVDSRPKQGHAFANRFSRRLLEEEKDCLCGYPGYQQESAGR